MPSEFDILNADIVAPSLMDVFAEEKAVIFRGLGENRGDLVVSAIVHDVTFSRETVDEGRRESRVNVEEVEIRILAMDVPLSTPVFIPSLGEPQWTIDRKQSGTAMISIWLYRSAPTQKQRANLERGVR